MCIQEIFSLTFDPSDLVEGYKMMRLSMNLVFVLYFCSQNLIESSFVCRKQGNLFPAPSLYWSIHHDETKLQSKISMSHFFRPVSVVSKTELKISSGLSFDDGDQLLVSAQKPLGLILEEDNDGERVIVTEVLEDSSASRAGIEVGDWLVAIQNADVSHVGLDEILRRISDAPRVVNLRFHRRTAYVDDYED